MFLANNCGLEVMNEMWQYNIKTDSWQYLKPFVDPGTPERQQKPYARYGHASVYVEIEEKGFNTTILRKYMYVYGGFSIYCQNACDDMWRYEIAYAPQQYYKTPSGWNRGNAWTKLETSSTYPPDNRIFHHMVVDSDYKYIYLFGGLNYHKYNEDGKDAYKYFAMNDLWRYSIESNIWESINAKGIDYISRNVF
jgi:hypothetical protein